MSVSSSSMKDLLKDYHQLAAETLLGEGSRSRPNSAIFSAAENGHLERLRSLISSSPSFLNARLPSSGDTPLITAARAGHLDVVHLLIKLGADVTVENDADENALDVASESVKRVILESIQHEDRAVSNAQALLQSAWLGDAVSVKKSLESGKKYLNVNCRNSDGLTPLLLVTRDISLFEQVQSAMENDYDPISVMEGLISSHADVNMCDKKGRSALHMVAASSEGLHARKMVSLLLSNGSSPDSLDEDIFSPLHIASSEGHTAIIVALVEEGGADINIRGGERGDTPLMLSARGGHNDAARYLISQGADITAVDENGDTALSVANSPSMVRLLKEAWVEKTQSDHSTNPSPSPNSSCDSTPPSSRGRGSQRSHPSWALSDSPLPPSITVTKPDISALPLHEINSNDTLTSPELAEQEKFFLTEGKIEDMSDCDETDYAEAETIKLDGPRIAPSIPVSEVEADDELDADHGRRRLKPATKRAHIREMMLTKRNSEGEIKENHTPKLPPGNRSNSISYYSTANDRIGYSSADEGGHDHMTRPTKRDSRQGQDRSSEDLKSPHRGGKKRTTDHKVFRPSELSLMKKQDPNLTRSWDTLVHVGVNRNTSTAAKKEKNFLPQVVKSPTLSPLSKQSKQPPRQRNERLPSLSNMKPVAMVAVDTDRDKLRIQKLTGRTRGAKEQDRLKVGGASPKSARAAEKPKESPVIQRSQSLMNFKKGSNGSEGQLQVGGDYLHKKRNSTGSVATRSESKVPFLPKVITSQFGLGIMGASVNQGAWSHTPNQSKGRGRFKNTPPHSPTSPMTPMLSSVNEDPESLPSDKTLTQTESFARFSSKDSTLKNSDFDTDSLEGHGVNIEGTRTKGEVLISREQRETRLVLPPPPQNSNLVVNYPNPHSTTPLSPIWDQIQYFRAESETSTNSEYITSYIGKMTPLPDLLSPDFNKVTPGVEFGKKTTGADSGQGESSGSEHGEGGTSSESGEEGVGGEKDDCLRWKRGKLLGKGAYGKVWEGLLKSARMIAVKEVELDTDSLERAQAQYEKIQAEVAILRSMKHKNIVSYMGTSMHLATVYIFMQYISGGSLQSMIKRFGQLESHIISHYTRQITCALSYLHGNGIIHRDIKGANIMVNSRGVIKLIDFGCAKNCQDLNSNMHSVRGTPYWMAPEVICGYGYGRKSDIWSLGCTVLEMATTKPPWADYPPEAAMFQIGMGKPIPPLPDHLPKTLTNFFYLCLTREQNQRPSANDLLEDKFLNIPLK